MLTVYAMLNIDFSFLEKILHFFDLIMYQRTFLSCILCNLKNKLLLISHFFKKSSDIQMMTRFVTLTLRLRLSVVQLFWICKRIPLQNTTVKERLLQYQTVKTEVSLK